jgi:hypothetical protein
MYKKHKSILWLWMMMFMFARSCATGGTDRANCREWG